MRPAVGQESVKLPEHAGRSPRCGHKLDDAEPFRTRVVPRLRTVGLRTVQPQNAVAGRSRPHRAKVGETPFEILDLPLGGLAREAVGLDLRNILGCKHSWSR